MPKELTDKIERRKALPTEERETLEPILINPEEVSINAIIDVDEFQCEWGSFSDCLLKVAEAPEGTEVAVFDVDAAFRNVPTRPAQRVFTAVLVGILILLGNNLDFGASPSPGIFGRIADAMVVILLAGGVEAVLKWVDDFIFFRYPKGRDKDGKYIYSYDATLIWNIASRLGWPWAPAKFVPFATSFRYIGFLWDLVGRTVQLPEEKKEKYKGKIAKILEGSGKITRKEADAIAGTLNHVCLVCPEGRSRMPSIYRFRATFKENTSRFLTHTITKDMKEDLRWWLKKLDEEFVGMQCVTPGPIDESVTLMVDASTSWGMGLVLNGKWLAWKFKEGWLSEGRNIGWGEMVIVEMAVRTLKAAGYTHSHIRLRSDNQGVIGALKAGYSRGKQQNAILRRIVSLMQDHDIWLTLEYVNTKENTADAPSRGQFGLKKDLLPYAPRIPNHLKPYVHTAVEYHDV